MTAFPKSKMTKMTLTTLTRTHRFLTPLCPDTVTYPLTKLGWDIGAEINPILYTKKEWEASRNTPFYHNVIKDAIAL